MMCGSSDLVCEEATKVGGKKLERVAEDEFEWWRVPACRVHDANTMATAITCRYLSCGVRKRR